jgi:hypothetical protein
MVVRCRFPLVFKGGPCHQRSRKIVGGSVPDPARTPFRRRIAMRLIVVIGLCAVVSAAVALGSEGPPKPPELKVLERFVGTWDAQSISKPAVWTPEEVREEFVEVRELVLDGWFLEGKARAADGKAGHFSWMMTYDVARKEYRTWLFVTGGFSIQWSGQWDEATKTFSFTGDAGNGVTYKGTTHFIDKDHYEFRLKATDGDGKVYQDLKNTLTRRVGKATRKLPEAK